MAMDVTGPEMPRPDRVTTPAEFVATMQALRRWAHLTYRQLEGKARAAGDRLPRSTIASALSGRRMPREQTIASFVRACGGDGSAVEAWLAARRRIAAADKTVSDLAAAVEAWLAARWWAGSPGAGALGHVEDGDGNGPHAYAQGRLAEAAAQSTSGRWIGLHRRRGSRATRLRRLAKDLLIER